LQLKLRQYKIKRANEVERAWRVENMVNDAVGMILFNLDADDLARQRDAVQQIVEMRPHVNRECLPGLLNLLEVMTDIAFGYGYITDGVRIPHVPVVAPKTQA
jgi:hypothetical protein